MSKLLKTTIYTYEDIHSLPDESFEIIDGERINMSPTGFTHSNFESKLAQFLENNLGEKGYVGVGEVGIIISRKPLRVRAADVVYLSKKFHPLKPTGMLETPPVLVIEILSETNTEQETMDKVKDYLGFGVSHVLYIDPSTEKVTSYKADQERVDHSFDEEFTVTDDLKIKIRDIL